MGALTKQSGTGFWRKEEIMKNYEDIMNSDIMKDESAPKSFYSNFMFKSIKMQYSIAKNDFEAARKYAEENVLLLEENCGRTENYHHKYIITLGNLLNMQVRTAGIEEMDKTVSKMKNLEKKFPGKIAANDKIYLFYLISVLMISRHLNCREPEKLKELVTETSNELSKYESRMPFQLRFIIYYFLGTSNFVISDFDKTIYWLGKIINSEKSAESEDYQSHSRIVNLLCYYEQKYFDSLEYVLKSTYHYLSKRKRIFKYENIILSYLRKSFRIKTERELYQMFDEMYYELKKIVNDPFEKNAFDTFNILYWLESKIKKIPLNEILKNAAISGSAR